MKRYLLTDEAKADLADIRAYLKREAGSAIAGSTINKIKNALFFLSNTPGAGYTREDLTNERVKFWQVFSYLIVYDPETRPIEILRIVHGSREVSALLAQDD